MNLPCKVVEDLLPMYFDCLCSDETATMVEQHLKNCPGCSRILAQLQTEFEIAEETVDDIKPLKALSEKWRRSKRSGIKKGICITLASIVAAIAVLSCTWYFRYGKAFFNMAENMEHTTDSDVVAADSNYKKELNGYRFDLWFPNMYGDNGYARVMDENGFGVFIYPQAGGGYSWKLYITDEEGYSRFVYLKTDLSPDFESRNTLLSAQQEKEKVEQLVADKKGEISALLETVKILWGIDLLEYTC